MTATIMMILLVLTTMTMMTHDITDGVANSSSKLEHKGQLTLLRHSAQRDACASRTYSKTNMARCALSCVPDDISEQYLERQLTLRQRKMADLYSREQYFRSVKIYKDVMVFDIEAHCFRSQLKNEESHRTFLSSTRVTWMHGRKINNQAYSELH